MTTYDVSYGPDGIGIDCHFCREWTLNTATGEWDGCYGTDPNHGYSFDEARALIVLWHRGEVDKWEKMTEEKWNNRYCSLDGEGP
jgi:hypothetical protein